MERILITNMARRSDKRLECPPVGVVVIDKEERKEAELVNLCRVGLRFKSGKEHKKGDKLSFELRGAKGAPNLSVNITGRVVNEYKDEASGALQYGVRFYSMQWHDMNMLHDFVYACEKQRKNGLGIKA